MSQGYEYERVWLMKVQMRRVVIQNVIFPFRLGPEYENI